MTWTHSSSCTETECYCADYGNPDPICDCGAPGWACQCEGCELCGTHHPDEPLICELAYAKMTSPKPPWAPGTRVYIPGLDTKGSVVEHVPHRGGYLVQPDGKDYAGGFGYSELQPLPPETKTRWDRILQGEL